MRLLAHLTTVISYKKFPFMQTNVVCMTGVMYTWTLDNCHCAPPKKNRKKEKRLKKEEVKPTTKETFTLHLW